MNETLQEMTADTPTWQEAFKAYADTNDWMAIWPEMALAVLALVVLVMEVISSSKDSKLAVRIAVVGQIAVAVGILMHLFNADRVYIDQAIFGGMITITPFTDVLRLFFVLSGLGVSFITSIYVSKNEVPKGEFYHLILIATASFMLLVQSTHFVMQFVALETVTVAFYVLVSYTRTSAFSLEAGLKYLIMGALSSSMLLFGIVLLYGVAGNVELPGAQADGMNFYALQAFLAANPDNVIALGGVALVISGICFKIGAVPFQIWVPDVYQGAPIPTTAFLAIASKGAGFGVLIALVTGPFAPVADTVLIPLLSAIAVVTILFGNLSALTQTNTKRMIGLSGIAHAGYLLVGVIALMKGVDWAAGAIVFYLFMYAVASFLVFGVIAHVSGGQDDDQDIEMYEDLAKRNPFLALMLTLGVGSLAGIPPLAGFIAKLLLFIAAYQAQMWTLLGVAIIGVVLSIYYYFGWIREAVFRIWRFTPQGEKDPLEPDTIPTIPGWHTAILGCLAVTAIVLGFYVGDLGSVIRY